MAISESRIKAKVLYNACCDKKAFDLVCLDVKKLSPITDYFIVASGSSERHVNAMAQAVWEELKGIGEYPRHSRDIGDGRWVLIDAKDVMVHLFLEEARDFYGLEDLWRSAKKVKFK